MVATTKMSSKGQVVIPEEIRDRLGLKAGSRFVVIGEGDVVILKALTAPSLGEFSELIRRVRKQGRKARMKRSDIVKATDKARRGK